MRNLKISWNDLSDIQISLFDHEVSNIIYKIFKNLQNVNLEFEKHPRDNPYSLENTSIEHIKQRLYEYAHKLNLDISDVALDQPGLNYLHRIYETQYNGHPDWLEFHECIHNIEIHNRNITKRNSIIFDYREKAGILTKPFKREWYKFSTTKVYPGMCYISWQELGKTPYSYYIDGEVEDISRMCELAKPWLLLKPNIQISTINQNLLENKNINQFNDWFSPYREQWTQHWKLDDWNTLEQFSVIPIGTVTEIDELINRFQSQQYPRFLKQ